MKLTQIELKEVLTYDPDTGVFTNKPGRGSGSLASGVCGCLNGSGYLQTIIKGKKYFLHRLAFLYMEGYLPEYEVDHKNGIKDDNRWCNLRHVSRSCNMQNKGISLSNKSGFSGVSWFKRDNKWRATSKIGGKCIHLGYYSSPLEAALARLTWELQCSEWTCDYRGVLIQQIKKEWPGFNLKEI